MSDPITIIIIGIVVLLALSAFFSGSASWIMTNRRVSVAYSLAATIAAADSISTPLSGSRG